MTIQLIQILCQAAVAAAVDQINDNWQLCAPCCHILTSVQLFLFFNLITHQDILLTSYNEHQVLASRGFQGSTLTPQFWLRFRVSFLEQGCKNSQHGAEALHVFSNTLKFSPPKAFFHPLVTCINCMKPHLQKFFLFFFYRSLQYRI